MIVVVLVVVTGGLVTGGLVTGGLVTGGLVTGGLVTGGLVTGGLVTGGLVTGGVVTGGVVTGGVVTGGLVAGGVGTMLLISETVQVTVPPPPLPELLHWLMVTGSAAVWVEGVTVHRTRIVAPPPFPDRLHWVMVALVVLPVGSQSTVGWVPPPAPEPLHWLIVAGLLVALPVMLLTTLTVQVTVPPPPLPEPLHWLIEVVRLVKDVVVVVHVSAALAAPVHLVTVTVEDASPVARSRLLVTVTSQDTAWPPTFWIPLHWSMAVVAAAALACKVIPARPPHTSSASPNMATGRLTRPPPARPRAGSGGRASVL